jgi:hypothetical protein
MSAGAPRAAGVHKYRACGSEDRQAAAAHDAADGAAAVSVIADSPD